MALIGTLRTKMTKVVVGGVALAMGAFIVGGDLFGNGPRSIFSGDKNTIGEINGHRISDTEFRKYLSDREISYQMNFGRSAGEREQIQLRQEAWELLILKYGITPQFEKVGQDVTTEEVEDMVWGKNIDPTIKSSFVDSTGNFNKARLLGWLQNLNAPENAQNKIRWDMFKENLVPGRARVKYENLLIKTSYVTAAEGEREYHDQNDVAEVKFLYVPFFAVSDSAVKVTDNDLSEYYRKNIERYKTEQTRSLSYIALPVIASKLDSVAAMEEFKKVAEGFKTSTDDSTYAASQTEGATPFDKFTIKTLPKYLSDDKSKLVQGAVYGPFLDGENYKIIKVVGIGTDTVSTARASHILIRWENETPEAKKAAKEKAQKILNDIKKGASFAAKAREFGTDGTKDRGGDLGYFSTSGQGRMVKEFEEPVFKAKKTGLINELVETQFGYHIIDVTSVKDNTSYKIATIELAINASDVTRNAVFRRAELFAADLSGADKFKEKAKLDTLVAFDANDLGTNERRIPNLGEAKSVISWLFKDDTKKGDVSEVFDVNDTYVVAVMTGQTDEGFKPMAMVSATITPIVKNELKAKIIIEKLNAQKGSLEEIAKAYGADAAVHTQNDLKGNTSQIPGIGYDPVAIGTAFSLENGKRSKPFAGETGVLIVETQTKTIAPEVGDYTMFKNNLEKSKFANVSFEITEALKEAAKIKDRRYKFF